MPSRFICAFAGFVAFSATSFGALVSSLPFSTDFDSGVTVGPSSTPTNTFYTAGTTGTAPALTAGPDSALRLVSNSSNSSAALQLDSSLTSGGFTMSMTFRIVASSGSANRNIALAFLGSSGSYDLSSNNNYRLNYGIDTGIISFQNNGLTDQFDGAGGSLVTATWNAGADRPTAGDTVTLSLTATYLTPTRLAFSGTASTDAGAATVSVSAQMETGAVAYTGTNFGVRSGSASGSSTTIDITHFSIAAIPEPSSSALALLAVLGLGLRRQRPN